MKNLLILMAICVSINVAAQNVELIYDEIRATQYQGRSYLVVKSMTIKPPVNGQFKVSAATDGPFYIKMLNASNDQNFVREENILVTGITQESQIPNLPLSERSVLFKYIDGMGREMEKVNVKGSPNQNDIIQAVYFDNMGNKTKEYLPYTHAQNNGAFRSDFDTESKNFYSSTPQVAVEQYRPFSQLFYENSSLGRVSESYGPGSDWFDASRKKKNIVKIEAGGSTIRWIYTDDNTPPSFSTYDTLLVNESIDEENHVIREFVDKRGLVILKQKQASGDYVNAPGSVTWHESYFIYDDLKRLKVVIPPEASSRLASEYITNDAVKASFLARWCFQFRYDDRGNLIAKWVPGWTDWQYIVYDKWNRKVLSQHPAQRQRNEWTFIKYDRLNREIMTGLWVTSTSVSTIRSNALSASQRYETEVAGIEGYSFTSTYPTSITASNLISITYYDNYNFLNYSNWDTGPNSNYNPVNVPGFPQSSTFLTNVTGDMTGNKIRVLGQDHWLNSVTRYDNKHRPVQIISENYLGGHDVKTIDYNFSSKIKQTLNTHTSSSASLSVLYEYVYDHANRPLRLYQTTGNGPRVLLASNKYNEAGQLIEKNIHSTDDGQTFLQSIDYRYNIRGWLTSINNSSLSNDGNLNDDSNDIFGMELQYNASAPITIGAGPEQFNAVKLYDHNISAVKWRVDTKQPSSSFEERAYAYQYDALSRMTKAFYATSNGGSWTANLGMFDESVKYDNNGNILGILRHGKIDGVKAVIDSMYYKYKYYGSAIPNFTGESNRLWKVKDSGNTYGFKDAPVQLDEEFNYDAGGNVIFDNNKQISDISYNYLNLPAIIQFTRPNGKVDRIVYTYNAEGAKLRTEIWKDGNSSSKGTFAWQTDYIGDIQYDKAQSSGPSNLTFSATPEGRVVKNGTAYQYEYFYKDHQGNIRATYGLLKETASYKATMERPIDRPLDSPPGSTFGDKEEQTFLNIASTRYQDPAFNYTRPSSDVLSPNKSASTNAFTGASIGPAKSFQVAAGDKVQMEIYAKYNVVTGNAATMTSSALITAVTGSFGINVGDQAYTGFSNNVPVIPGSGTASSTVPKAYLAYLFFSNDVFVSSGAIAITASAFNAFEKLERTFTAPQNGKIYIYVANETYVANNISVYFDELLIVHQKNNSSLQVTQASDYYPFGLSYNTFQSNRFNDDYSHQHKNRYGFQGQELQKDLDLGWSQFKWRMHDPALGRFGAVDPLSEKYAYNSPYAFQENKIGGGVELEGTELMPWDAIRFGQFLYGISPYATVEKGVYAMRDYQANEISYATTRGEQYQSAIVHNKNLQAIDASYKLNQFKAKTELIEVGMEWTAFALTAGIGALENIGANVAVRQFSKIMGKAVVKEGVEEIAENSAKAMAKETAEMSVIKTGQQAVPANRLKHIFGKAEHALESLVNKYGSQEAAYNAVQEAANEALKAGKLHPNAEGILPNGDFGDIINVGGMDVRLIGGKVENGQVIISSFSRKGL